MTTICALSFILTVQTLHLVKGSSWIVCRQPLDVCLQVAGGFTTSCENNTILRPLLEQQPVLFPQLLNRAIFGTVEFGGSFCWRSVKINPFCDWGLGIVF